MSLKRRIEQLEEEAATRRRIAANRPVELDFDDWLPVVSTAMDWDWPHLVHVREALDKVTSGEIRKLMVFMPPRHGKSELVTIRYPAWRLERKPTTRVIIGSYNATLAEKFGRRTRQLCTDRIMLSDDRSAAGDWETEAGGGLRAVGVGGGITGRGGDLVIIDDPVKSRDEANSEAYRERVWSWYTDDLYTRLEPGAAVILIITRWHMDDLAGRILASEDAGDWTVISLPALAEANDPLGRSEGDALCPERFDVPALEQIRTVMGSSFQALYQQRPSALEGAIFKREWWQYFREQPKCTRIVQSWDTAFKAGADNDFSVCTTWGEAENGWYLLDRFSRRLEFPALKAMAMTLAEQWKPSVVLVEDKASGQSLIQELKRDTRLPILAIKVDSDKVSRAYAVTPSVETGRVFLPEAAPWLADYIDNMAAFPNGVHDDDVDSSTQALNYLIGRGGAFGVFEFIKRQAEGVQAKAAAELSPTLRMRAPPGVHGLSPLEGGEVVPTDEHGTLLVPRGQVPQLVRSGWEVVPEAAA